MPKTATDGNTVFLSALCKMTKQNAVNKKYHQQTKILLTTYFVCITNKAYFFM